MHFLQVSADDRKNLERELNEIRSAALKAEAQAGWVVTIRDEWCSETLLKLSSHHGQRTLCEDASGNQFHLAGLAPCLV